MVAQNTQTNLMYGAGQGTWVSLHFLAMHNTVKTPNKRKIGRALFFSYREFSLTRSFFKVQNEIAKTGLLNGFVGFIIFDYMQNISRLHPMT